MTTETSTGVTGVDRALPTRISHYIGGEHVDSVDGSTVSVDDPVTNAHYADVATGRAADVDRAVSAASDAFSSWAEMSARHRSNLLIHIADAIERRADVIVAFESFDTGLPINQSRGLAARAAENFPLLRRGVRRDPRRRVQAANQFGYVVRSPKGVA